MKHDALDRILEKEDELTPSSGFLSVVMERVREEATAPPPIPFPWKRAIPGFVVAVGVLVWGLVELVRYIGTVPSKTISLAPSMVMPHLAKPGDDVTWIALALGISAASWWLSRRLAGRSGLI